MSSGEIFTAGESSTRPGGGVSPSGELGDAAVFEFDVAETIEAFAVSVGDEAEGIPAAEFGGGCADFVVECPG